MKIVGITLLTVASIAVLLGLVLPVVVTRVFGLGIDVPGPWDRTARVLWATFVSFDFAFSWFAATERLRLGHMETDPLNFNFSD
jgi:hypothetical protein